MMTKKQFIRATKLRGRIIYLKRVKAAMEADPKKRPTIQPSKQDYLKAAGQILGEILTKSENQNLPAPEQEKETIPMINSDPKTNNTVSMSGKDFLQLEAVAKTFYEKGRTENPPKFVIFTGGVGAGKTTERKRDYAEGYVNFDLAEIHAALKKAIGENNQNLAAYGSQVAGMILSEALEKRRNIVIEIIGADHLALAPIMDKIIAAGYKIEIKFILADVAESYKRHLKLVEDDPNYLSSFFTEEATLTFINHHLP